MGPRFRRLRRRDPKGGEAAWVLLGVATASQAAVSTCEMGVAVLIPLIKSDLGISIAMAGLLVSSLNLGRVFGAVAAGRVLERVTEESMLGVAGCGVASLIWVTATAQSFWPAMASLFVLGLFAGSTTPTGARLILSAFPARRRGLAMGIRQSAIPLGTLVAAAAAPALAEATDWRLAITLIAIPTVVCAALAFACVRAYRRRGRLLGPVAGTAAAVPATRTRTLLRDRSVRSVLLLGPLLAGGQYALVTYLILALTSEVGISTGLASAALATASALGVAGRIGWGAISDGRFGGDRIAPLALIAISGIAAGVLLAAMPTNPPAVLVILIAALAGISFMSWQGVWVNLLAETGMARGSTGAVVGLGVGLVNAGIVVWPAAIGLIAQLAGGFRPGWAVIAGAAACALVLLRGIGVGPSSARDADDSGASARSA